MTEIIVVIDSKNDDSIFNLDSVIEYQLSSPIAKAFKIELLYANIANTSFNLSGSTFDVGFTGGDEDGNTFTVSIVDGLYDADTLATHLQAQTILIVDNVLIAITVVYLENQNVFSFNFVNTGLTNVAFDAFVNCANQLGFASDFDEDATAGDATLLSQQSIDLRNSRYIRIIIENLGGSSYLNDRLGRATFVIPNISEQYQVPQDLLQSFMQSYEFSETDLSRLRVSLRDELNNPLPIRNHFGFIFKVTRRNNYS